MLAPELLYAWSMIALFIVIGVIAVGFVVGFIATATAPMGYQDETGFHYGQEQGAETVATPKQVPYRVPQPRLA